MLNFKVCALFAVLASVYSQFNIQSVEGPLGNYVNIFENIPAQIQELIDKFPQEQSKYQEALDYAKLVQAQIAFPPEAKRSKRQVTPFNCTDYENQLAQVQANIALVESKINNLTINLNNLRNQVKNYENKAATTTGNAQTTAKSLLSIYQRLVAATINSLSNLQLQLDTLKATEAKLISDYKTYCCSTTTESTTTTTTTREPITDDFVDICVVSFGSRKCSCFAIDEYNVVVPAKCIPESHEKASVKFSQNSGYFSVITVENISFPDELLGRPIRDIAMIKLSNPIKIDDASARKEALINSKMISGVEALTFLKENVTDTLRTCGTQGDFVKCHDVDIINYRNSLGQETIEIQTADGNKLDVGTYGGPVQNPAPSGLRIIIIILRFEDDVLVQIDVFVIDLPDYP